MALDILETFRTFHYYKTMKIFTVVVFLVLIT